MVICIIFTYNVDFSRQSGRVWTPSFFAFCERIWQGQCICSVKFHRYCQILKFDGSEFIIEEEDCKLQLINLLQFPIPVSNSSCVYNGKRVQVAYIWKSQDYKRTLCVCVHSRVKSMSKSRIYFSEKKNLLIGILVFFLSDFLYWKQLIKIWHTLK